MEERAIVEALCQRDPAGLAAAYDQYAARLYDYCAGLLHDRDAAGDAVHDALLAAADKAHQLRDPGRLRAWLYAIARNECMRQLRRGNRLAPLERAGDVSEDTADLGGGIAAEQAQALVRDALTGLNERDREVLELALRHELSGAELAAALGISANHAHALLSRAKDQLERAVGALLTARSGQGDCAELATVLANWDGEFTPLVRKRVSRHIEKCAVCGVRRAHEVRAEALFAALPFLALPALLRRRVLESAENLETVAYRGKIAEPFDRSGFPVPLDRRRWKPRPLAWAGGAAVLALLLGGGAAAVLRPGPNASVAEPRPRPSAAATSAAPAPVTAAPVLPSPIPSPSLSPSPPVLPSPSATRRPPPPRPIGPAAISPAPSPTRPSSPSPRPSPSPSPLGVDPPILDVPKGCVSDQTWSAATRTSASQPGAIVAFVWSVNGGATQAVQLTRQSNGTYTGQISGLPTGKDNVVTYYSTARSGRQTAKSASQTASVPFCIIG